MNNTSKFLEKFKKNKLAVIVDDSEEQRRSILVSPAQDITPEHINRMLHISGGLTYVALPEERADSFLLEPMSRPATSNSSPDSPSYNMCVSIDAREGITTGISASDRAICISILAETNVSPSKLVKPGHIFPVKVKNDGILVKPALPEAAYDLVRLAELGPAACFMDLFSVDGKALTDSEHARLEEQQELAFCTVSELTRLRLETELLVTKIAETKLPTHEAGILKTCVYKVKGYGGEHIALIKGDISKNEVTLTRVQTESTLDDVFGHGALSSRKTLQNSLKAIAKQEAGVLLYLRKPQRGQILPQEANSSAASMREYGIGAQILYDLGVRKIALISNSKKKLVGLHAFDIEIVSQHTLDELDYENSENLH